MSQHSRSEHEGSRLIVPHLSISEPSDGEIVQGHPSEEGASLLSTRGRYGAKQTRQRNLGLNTPRIKPAGGGNDTLFRATTADNSLSTQVWSTEGSNPNELEIPRNNPKLPYDEEIYSRILHSNDPIWDFLHLRIRTLEKKGDDMTDMEVSELDYLRGMDNDLRWGRFLGYENAGRVFLRSQFYRDTLDTRISQLINKAWTEDEALQTDDPVKFYLIWRSKKQLRETLWAEDWGVNRETTVHVADLDDVIRNLPQRETSRVLKRNELAHDCCNKLLTGLLKSKEKLYEPEIRHLEKLLNKFKRSRMWNLVAPVRLTANAACFFGSMKEFKPLAAGYYSLSGLLLGPLFLAGSAVTATRARSILSGRRSAEHWSQYVLLSVSSASGFTSFILRMRSGSDACQYVAVGFDVLLQVALTA